MQRSCAAAAQLRMAASRICTELPVVQRVLWRSSMKKPTKHDSPDAFDRHLRELTHAEKKQAVGGGGSAPQPDVFGRTL
jgi:hypothetical protein